MLRLSLSEYQGVLTWSNIIIISSSGRSMAVAYNVVTGGAADALPERAVLRVCLSLAAARLAVLALVMEATCFSGAFCATLRVSCRLADVVSAVRF